jgi:hypothetical protein
MCRANRERRRHRLDALEAIAEPVFVAFQYRRTQTTIWFLDAAINGNADAIVT